MKAREHRPDHAPSVQRATRSDRAVTPGKRTLTMGLPARGGGAAMPAAVQAKMEQAFGADFSAVRIHQGPQAPAIGALAYAQGTDIHFAPGQYEPDSERGQALLGHELAHVVQQAQGRVGATMQSKGVAINDDSALEREADEMGARAARGQPASGAASPAATSEPAAAVAQAKAGAPALSVNGAQVVQMTPAFRIEGSRDNRKITNDSGTMKLNKSEVQATGISISFKSGEHANYYAGQKQGGVFLTLDASDKFYGYLQEKFKSNAKIKEDDNYEWMANLPKPSGCSDPVMNSLGMSDKDVLSFQTQWFAKDKNISSFEKQFTVTSAVSLDQVKKPSEEQSSSSGQSNGSGKVYIVIQDVDETYAYEVDASRKNDVIEQLNLKEGEYTVVDNRNGVGKGVEISSY